MNEPQPPRWPSRLLETFCAPHLLEEVQGDLQELYGEWVREYGERRAGWLYLFHSVKFIRLYRIKRFSSRNLTPMLKNYGIIAFRNLLRQKGYSVLNILGLALGLACSFLITLWIQDELNYDGFHASGDQLYRVMRHVHSDGQITTSDRVSWNIANGLREYPEVKEVSVTYPTDLVMNSGELSVREAGIYATPDFFTMFTWHLVRGQSDEVLRDPASVVISVSLAEKYFGDEWRTQAIGKTIHDEIGDLGNFTVTGVFEDIPRHSSLQFDFVLPMAVFERRNDWLFNWMNSGVSIFARLHEGTDGAVLSRKITDIQNEHIEGFRSDLFLQPYADQHLYSGFQDGVLSGGRIEYVRMFAIVALVIILIACINFMNLATARSMRRAKEVGRAQSGRSREAFVGRSVYGRIKSAGAGGVCLSDDDNRIGTAVL